MTSFESAFENLNSLETVTIVRDHGPIDWQQSKLIYAEVREGYAGQFTASAGSIKTIKIHSTRGDLELTGLTSYSVLEELEIWMPLDFEPSGPFTLHLPATLKSLSIQDLAFSTNTFNITGDALTHLRLSSGGISYDGAWPPNLESMIFYEFRLHSTPPSPPSIFPPALVTLEILITDSWDPNALRNLGACSSLTNLFLDFNLENVLSAMPDLTSTQLSNVTIRSSIIDDDTQWNDIFCGKILGFPTAPTNTTYRFHTVYISADVYAPQLSCLIYLNKLKSLTWTANAINLSPLQGGEQRGSRLYDHIPRSVEEIHLNYLYTPQPKGPYGMVDWDTFISHFYDPEDGYTGLKSLTMNWNGIDGSFPAAQLVKWAPNIEKIDMRRNGLNGTLPSSYFVQQPHLRILNIDNNLLTGTIPNRGWATLETFSAINNLFTVWPSIYLPIGNITTIRLRNNTLLDIPDDTTFQAMINLKRLDLSLNRGLAGALPNVFGPESIVEFFDASDCAFDGQFPVSEIQNPVMTTFRASNNRICRLLPHVLPDTFISTFTISNNRLNGSYPTSWRWIQAGLIDVSGNFLGGAVTASGFHYGFASSSTHLNFGRNQFMGQLFDVTSYKNLVYLGIEGNDFEVCSGETAVGMSATYCNLTIAACSCVIQRYNGCENIEAQCPSSPTTPFGAVEPTPAALPGLCGAPSVVRTPVGVVPAAPTPPVPVPSVSPPQAKPCPLPKPSPGNWTCLDNGTWSLTGSVSSTTLVLPPGPVIVSGNLTITGTVTFTGPQSTLKVEGCIFLGNGSSRVILEVTKDDLDRISKEGKKSFTLIQSSGNNSCPNSTDLSTVNIQTQKKGSSCKKVSIQNTSSRSSLSLIMAVDNRNCNMIIIIPSVVGGILLIVAVSVVVWLALKRDKAMKAKRVLAG